MKKIVIIILTAYVLGIITPLVIKAAKKNILENQVIYTIRIEREFINLRPEVDLNTDVIRQVYKGEKFKVVKYYEGNTYNWYNVIYENGKSGWIADTKDNEWITIESGCK